MVALMAEKLVDVKDVRVVARKAVRSVALMDINVVEMLDRTMGFYLVVKKAERTV